MKKFVFEAAKKQLEKPTEPKYVFCARAQVIVYADTKAQAKKLAEEKLRENYQGKGTVLGEAEFVRCDDLPADWSYGYGDERQTGAFRKIKNPNGNYVIR